MENQSTPTTEDVNKVAGIILLIPEGATLSDVERKYILRILEDSQGNKTKAAKVLGVTIKTLYNKLHEYGLFEQFQNQKGVKENAN